MKPIKYKEFRYKSPLYSTAYRFIITNDVVGLMHAVHKYDAEGAAACTVLNHQDNTIDVVIPSNCKTEWMYHEATHLAMCILGSAGVKYGFDNQEPLAYL